MMYSPSLEEIKELRKKTSASISYCKQALIESGGDKEKAERWLEEKGIAKAETKTGRTVGAGIIDSYVHFNKQVGVLLDLRCETDFVARNEEFAALAHELCLQIAAMNPQWISREDVPPSIVEKRKNMYLEEIKSQNKPADIAQKIVEGKMNSFFQEVCLLEQSYIKEETKTVKDLIDITIGKLGENIKVGSFCRFSI